jgi:hypothetical protein
MITEAQAQARRLTVTTDELDFGGLEAAWDERLHPRVPGGEGGGEFTRKDPGGYTGPTRPPHQRHDLLASASRELLAELDNLDRAEHLDANGGDPVLARITHLQGFDRPPATGTAEQLAAEEAHGGRRLYRGVTSPSYAAAYVAGKDDNRQGFGLALNGNYFTTDPDVAAAGYAGSHGGVIEGVLRSDANIADRDELMAEARAFRRDLDWGEPGNGYWATADLGRYAALRGYDAVGLDMRGAPGEWDTFIVLNRGALLVQP